MNKVERYEIVKSKYIDHRSFDNVLLTEDEYLLLNFIDDLYIKEKEDSSPIITFNSNQIKEKTGLSLPKQEEIFESLEKKRIITIYRFIDGSGYRSKTISFQKK